MVDLIDLKKVYDKVSREVLKWALLKKDPKNVYKFDSG